MKYCTSCGNAVCDEAAICVKCGEKIKSATPKDNTIATVIKVFMILGCVASGWLIVPLLWCIPLTVYVFRCLRIGRPINNFVKICSLLFVNLIAGVCMFFVNDIEN